MSEKFLLRGGLDLVTPPEVMEPGRALSAINLIATEEGYERAPGYERFDGRPKPSVATVVAVPFVAGSIAIEAGDLVAGIDSETQVVALNDAVVYSGSYGAANAVGVFFYDPEDPDMSGAALDDAEGLLVGGLLAATHDADGDYDDDDEAEAVAQAKTNRRALIEAVPGEGPCLGGFVLSEKTYAFRKKTGVSGFVGMYEATTSGWIECVLGERVSFTNANTSVGVGDTLTKGGVTATIRAVAISSGSLSSGTNAGWFTISGRAGGNFSAGAATTTGGGACTLSGAEVEQSFFVPPVAGGSNFYRVAVGRVSDDEDNAAYICPQGFSNPAFRWDGTYLTAIPDSESSLIPVIFQNHLFLMFASGRVRFSELNNAIGVSTTAGAGDDFIGTFPHDAVLVSHDTLAIIGRNRIGLLQGTDQDTFSMTFLSRDAGGYQDTAQAMAYPVYADPRGVRYIFDVETSAAFKTGSLAEDIAPLFVRWEEATNFEEDGVDRWQPRLSFRNRGRDLYAFGIQKVITSDSSSVSSIADFELIAGYFGRDQRRPEWTRLNIPINAQGIWSSPSDGTDIDTVGRESILIFGADGFVYEWGWADSYDGADITTILRLPFNDASAPDSVKRCRNVEIEVRAKTGFNANLAAKIDLDQTGGLDMASRVYRVVGGEADWQTTAERDFLYKQPIASRIHAEIDARCRSIALELRATTGEGVKPYTWRTVSIDWLKRKELRLRGMTT